MKEKKNQTPPFSGPLAFFEMDERQREKALAQAAIHQWLADKIRELRRQRPGELEKIYRQMAQRALGKEELKW